MEAPKQLLMSSSNIDLNSAADKVSFPCPFPMKIASVGLVCLVSDAGDVTVAFDKRPTAGSDSSRGSADLGQLSLSSAVAGKVFHEDKISTEILCAAGDEIVVEVTAENVNANTFARPFIEYYRIVEPSANQSDRVSA